MPLTVVFDTNMLTVPAQFNLDIFKEAEETLERNIDFVVIESVVEELQKKLERASRTEKQRFKIALDLVSRCRIARLEEPEPNVDVDQQIIKFAKSTKGVIATNDRELINQAIQEGIPILFLRGKKRLELRGTIS